MNDLIDDLIADLIDDLMNDLIDDLMSDLIEADSAVCKMLVKVDFCECNLSVRLESSELY